jgi:hypothetical protein
MPALLLLVLGMSVAQDLSLPASSAGRVAVVAVLADV